MSYEPALVRILANAALPSPGPVALELLELTRQAEVDLQAVARIASTDPAICARTMHAVNAASRGSGRYVESIERAVTTLGLRAIARIAVEVTVLERHRGGVAGFDYAGFWAESLARAVAAKHVAARSGTATPDEAFTYGLLGTIGRLALVTVYPTSYADMVRTLGRCDRSELTEAERAVFGVDVERLSAAMMERWGLPVWYAALTGGVDLEPRVLERHRRGLAVGRVAQRIALLMVDPDVGRRDIAAVMDALAELGIGTEAATCLFPEIADAANEAGRSLRIVLPLPPSLADLYVRVADAV